MRPISSWSNLKLLKMAMTGAILYSVSNSNIYGYGYINFLTFSLWKFKVTSKYLLTCLIWLSKFKFSNFAYLLIIDLFHHIQMALFNNLYIQLPLTLCHVSRTHIPIKTYIAPLCPQPTY